MKLRWKESYNVEKIVKNKQLMFIKNIHSKKIKDQYYINDLKLFILKTEYNLHSERWQSIIKSNEELWKILMIKRKLNLSE